MYIIYNTQISGGELVWSDGSPIDFTAWTRDGRNEKVDCVRLQASASYRWGDKSCSRSYGYICEIEVGGN